MYISYARGLWSRPPPAPSLKGGGEAGACGPCTLLWGLRPHAPGRDGTPPPPPQRKGRSRGLRPLHPALGASPPCPRHGRNAPAPSSKEGGEAGACGPCTLLWELRPIPQALAEGARGRGPRNIAPAPGGGGWGWGEPPPGKDAVYVWICRIYIARCGCRAGTW